jgi:hypothetical protein
MKKLVTALSVISSLSLSAVPVFAQGNIYVKANGYAHQVKSASYARQAMNNKANKLVRQSLNSRLNSQVNQRNINIKGNKIAHQTININNVHTTNNFVFSDIKGNWAEQDILNLVGKGILTGMGNNKFEPNGQVTREQFATMVAKFFNLKSTSTAQDFNDVSATRWSYDSIEAVKNYIDAYNNLNGGLDFRPTSGMLREDVAVTLVKILTKTDAGITLVDGQAADQILQSNFKDADQIAQVLRPYVATAVKYGLIHGANGSFAPTRTLTRAEVAKLLHTIEGMGSQIVIPDDTNGNTTTADSIGIADPTSANTTTTDSPVSTDTTNGITTTPDSSLNTDTTNGDTISTDSPTATDTTSGDTTTPDSSLNTDTTDGNSTTSDSSVTTDSTSGDTTTTGSPVTSDTTNGDTTTTDSITVNNTTNPVAATF